MSKYNLESFAKSIVCLKCHNIHCSNFDQNLFALCCLHCHKRAYILPPISMWLHVHNALFVLISTVYTDACHCVVKFTFTLLVPLFFFFSSHPIQTLICTYLKLTWKKKESEGERDRERESAKKQYASLLDSFLNMYCCFLF